MPTIADVAERAGVSIASVSLVINDPDTRRVGEEKRKRILRVAKKLGYSPNLLAKGLLKRGTRVLGLIVPMRDPIFFNLFIAEMLAGIQACLQQRGYHLVVYSHNSARGKITRTELLQSRFVDGVIFINTRVCAQRDMDATILDLSTNRIPFVMIGSYFGPQAINYVGVNDFEIGQMAGDYLVRKGHPQVALLLGSSRSPASPPQLEGFRQALARHGVSLAKNLMAYGEYDKERIRTAVETWFRMRKRPTAVFCASDQMVPDVYELLREHGIQIPTNMAVVGRGDLMFAPLLSPPLTTIKVPVYELGYRGAELLIDAIQQPEAPTRQITLPCELVERGSA